VRADRAADPVNLADRSERGGFKQRFGIAKANADGLVDAYLVPKAPAGRENNWIQTVPGKGWFIIQRLSGALEPWFDKTWRSGGSSW